MTKQQVSEDAAYVGLTAKGLAQEALIKTATATNPDSTDAAAREQVQEDSAPKAEAQSPKDLLGTKSTLRWPTRPRRPNRSRPSPGCDNQAARDSGAHG